MHNTENILFSLINMKRKEIIFEFLTIWVYIKKYTTFLKAVTYFRKYFHNKLLKTARKSGWHNKL